MSNIFSKIGKGIEIMVIGIIIIIVLFILLLILAFAVDYSQYVHGDINKIKYAEPTEEAKNFDIEEYIKNLPPVEYTKIDYPVKETVKYEFNGYVLTMDIPEGMDYCNNRYQKDYHGIIKSKSIEDSVEPGGRDGSLPGPGTGYWGGASILSSNSFKIKDEKERNKNLKYCNPSEKAKSLFGILPYKSKYKGISMRDVFINEDIKLTEKNYKYYKMYKHKTSSFNFLIKEDDRIGYSADLLLSDQQSISLYDLDNLSKDMFFSMLDTVKIEKIEK